MEAWGLAADDLVEESMERCREVAQAAAEAGAEAVRWPSATGVGHSFAIFLERLRSGSQVKIAKTIDVTREALAALERGESVLQLLPALAGMNLLT